MLHHEIFYQHKSLLPISVASRPSRPEVKTKAHNINKNESWLQRGKALACTYLGGKKTTFLHDKPLLSKSETVLTTC